MASNKAATTTRRILFAVTGGALAFLGVRRAMKARGRTDHIERSIFLMRPPAEVEQAWRDYGRLPREVEAGTVRFEDVPGGTILHVGVRGKGGGVVSALAKEVLQETLRRFRARLETGEVPTIEGQSAGGKS